MLTKELQAGTQIITLKCNKLLIYFIVFNGTIFHIVKHWRSKGPREGLTFHRFGSLAH